MDLYHPDAHPNEDFEYYNEKITEINNAYETLNRHCVYIQNKNSFNDREEQRVKQQTEKEKILMDIIVRAYYVSKVESEVMKKYVKMIAQEFAQKCGIEINFLEVVSRDYINFLNNTDWYEKYINY